MEAPSPIYVQPADEVMFKTAMSMVDFVPTDQSGNATIVVMTPSEATLTIANLNLNKLEKVCPLLGMSFEQSRSGGFKYCLEARSRVLAVSFLRFLCTGSYLIKDEDGLTVVPSSLFFHAEMYHLACTFDVGDLKKEAKANMMRVTEFSCSTPKPPRELCETIRFVYERLRNERELIGLIQHYCVNCFTYHQLNEDLIFRALIDDLPTFGIDLCTTNIQRNFEDEGTSKYSFT